MPATHRNSHMKFFLRTEVSSVINLQLKNIKIYSQQDLTSVESKTKRSGISTKTTPATVDLLATMVCRILTSPPTPSCNPPNPPRSYSSSITSGSWKHQLYNDMWSLCRLQAERPCTQCSAVVSAVNNFSSRQPSLSSDYQNKPGQPRPRSLRMSLSLKCSSDICCNLFRRQQDLQMIFLILLVQ